MYVISVSPSQYLTSSHQVVIANPKLRYWTEYLTHLGTFHLHLIGVIHHTATTIVLLQSEMLAMATIIPLLRLSRGIRVITDRETFVRFLLPGTIEIFLLARLHALLGMQMSTDAITEPLHMPNLPAMTAVQAIIMMLTILLGLAMRLLRHVTSMMREVVMIREWDFPLLMIAIRHTHPLLEVADLGLLHDLEKILKRACRQGQYMTYMFAVND